MDDYTLDMFCGPARIYSAAQPMTNEYGYIFRDQNIDNKIAEEITRIHPCFVALASTFEFDVEIEKDLLKENIVVFERIANTDQLPDEFEFYGMPLKIREGDGSPVRAFAVVR